jgi:dTDP-glucose pyrophosphorylase/CBS domain-containing protein
MLPRNFERLNNAIIAPSVTITEAIYQLDRAGTRALLVCTGGRKLYGILTDGDLRRALLKRVDLTAPCSTITNRQPITSNVPLLPIEALHLLDAHDIDHLPILNVKGEVIDFLLRADFGLERELVAHSRERLDSVIAHPGTAIAEAISQLDKAGTGVLLLSVNGTRLAGLLTDGDIRRAILRSTSLDTPCERIATQQPTVVLAPISATAALQIMNQRDIHQLPVVDSEGNVIDLILRKDIVAEVKSRLSAVIMAGGYGKRLLPLTEHVPKPMLPVGDRPLLERTIERLSRSEIREISLITHYLAESIEKHFGDGRSFGVRLNYVQEKNPLGTAGGLKLMKKPTHPFVVINGDILTGLSFDMMYDFHRKHGAQVTVGVRKYEVKVPYGVVECDDVKVMHLKEKPSLTFFVNAGIYILEPTVFDYIPDGQHFNMTDLIQKLLEQTKPIISFPVMEYWLDIGQHQDYQQAQEDVRSGKYDDGNGWR